MLLKEVVEALLRTEAAATAAAAAVGVAVAVVSTGAVALLVASSIMEGDGLNC